jgi:hypothetical protein
MDGWTCWRRRRAGRRLFHEHYQEASVHLQIAQLCIKAGADTGLISRWSEEGRRRAAAAKQPPFTD